MLKTQKRIWMPILVAAGLFSVSGIFHIAEHFFDYVPELNLASEFFLIVELATLALSIFRYWNLQKEYVEIKRRGLEESKN